MMTTTLLVLILMLMLLTGIVKAAFRLAWGTTKFLFGLGLFWICPLLFILVVLAGGFAYMWLPIVIVGILFGRGFRRL